MHLFTFFSMCQGANQWYELQDLHVQDLLAQMITLAEAYVQVHWSCDSHVTFMWQSRDSILYVSVISQCICPDMGAE